MDCRHGLTCVGLLLMFALWAVCATDAAEFAVRGESKKPNVLLIVTDDQGYGDIRSHGNEHIDTPVLDRLAEDGARFERFYVSPVCAPTRASLLSGRYHPRCGVHGVTRGYENMRNEEVTLAEIFKLSGYATGAFGKVAQWAALAHGPTRPGFRRVLRFLWRALEPLFRYRVGTRRPSGEDRGLYRRCVDRRPPCNL